VPLPHRRLGQDLDGEAGPLAVNAADLVALVRAADLVTPILPSLTVNVSTSPATRVLPVSVVQNTSLSVLSKDESV
jgi:hypothetical protein